MTLRASWTVDMSTASVTILMPLHLVNITNVREHHMARHRRAKRQRWLANVWVEQATREARRWLVASKVTITRIAPRKLDDDGAVASAKSVRDGVADALGVDDGDPSIKWEYGQRRGKPREYAAEVRIE